MTMLDNFNNVSGKQSKSVVAFLYGNGNHAKKVDQFVMRYKQITNTGIELDTKEDFDKLAEYIGIKINWERA